MTGRAPAAGRHAGGRDGRVVRVSRQAAANFLLERLGLLGRATPAPVPAVRHPSAVPSAPGPADGGDPAGGGAGLSDAAAGTRRRTATAGDVLAVLTRLGAVQLDPVNVVERNHHLVFFNRLPGYRPALFEELYDAGQVFEAWCHARCALPVSWYPAFRPAFRTVSADRLDPAVREWMGRILEMVATGGAVSPRRIDSGERVIGYWDRDVPATRAVSQALQHLWEEGRLVVRSRRGNERTYDLPERVLPKEVLVRQLDAGEAAEQRIRHYAQAMVLFDPGDPYFGWHRWPAPRRREEAERRVAVGEWVRVEIEGVKRPYYAAAEDRERLESAGELPESRSARFLPPLDNLLWRRSRVRDLFGFDYTWEIYIPAAKRRYGPYTMPVLYRNRLVGRIDLEFRQVTRTLVVHRLALEPAYERWNRSIQRAVAAEVERLGRYLGAASLERTPLVAKPF
ncbi:winged helix-turn-helix domain-containing protein [Thermaerobacter composti]|uniref:Crosslink repair DNA glycosylase YcaQ family protein n=1 Tax=Thermaerobacter composti TaxID=554949 RepID=A0ABZ0QSJ7_9FIRM|nr:crosslink repair DNA glycosylase YcaQ family protein [Thermaerobacter composti]WPD19398.1 crosslink repair DNA glycosylase YcaQ family protein [Thermaerobacter composti]